MREYVLKIGINRPIPTLLITLALILFASWGLQDLPFKGDSRVFFSASDPQLQAFDQMEDVYSQSDNVVFLIAPKNGDIFTQESLTLIHQLTESAWLIPYASRVDSITNYQHTYANGDELVVEDLVLNPSALSTSQIARLESIALNEPLLTKRLISPRGHVSVVNVTLQMPDIDGQNEIMEVSQYARQISEDIKKIYPGVDIYLSGLVMMDVAFAEASLQDNEVLIPLMFGVVILTIGFLLRTVTGTISTVVIAALAIAVPLGVFGWMGMHLTPPSVAAPIMILTISVADCVHILSTMLQQMREGVPRRQALYNSLSINFKPIFLTSATTALGFLSMNFSGVPPFQDLGNIVALGVITAFILSITLLPALLSLLPLKSFKSHNQHHSQSMKWLSHFVVSRRNLLLPGISLVVALTTPFIFSNELNDRYVEFFDRSTPFRISTEALEKELSGVDTLEYSINTGVPGGLNSPEVTAAIDHFSKWLRSLPEVDHVNTITDTLKRLNKNMHGDDPAWYKLPDNQELSAQYLLLYEMSLPQGLDLNSQINVDKSSTRVIATLKNLPTYQLLEFEQKSNEWFERNYPELNLKTASISLMFAHISKKNINSMLLTSIFALVLISPILGFVLRSTKYGFISLVPNLTPAAVAFGLWGFYSGEVGLGLSVIIGMTLGIVVDDTVHFISKYREARLQKQMSPEDAVHYTFQKVGPALWITCLILVAGFIIMAQSSYRVNAEMGIMTALTIIIALVMDFLLLPPLLLAADRASTAQQPKSIKENPIC